MTGYSDEQIEADLAELNRREYGPSTTEETWQRIVIRVADAAPGLLARARKAEAERDRQRARADHNANAVNENADMIVRLRAELAEAKAEADELRRLLLDETYRPEGGEIVMRELNAARSERDAERRRADHNANAVNENADMIVHLRAELADAKAENEVLRQVAQSDRETAKDYADEIAAAHAERDRLAAQVAAVRALADKLADGWLGACRYGDERPLLRAIAHDLRAALDGTEQDEAKAPIRATCSGGGPSTEPGMALIEFRVPQGTERRLGAEWLLTPVSRPTEGDEQ